MNKIYFLTTILAVIFLASCGGDQRSTTRPNEQPVTKPQAQEQNDAPASERIALDNKGVGKIQNLTLNPSVDEQMAERGKLIFDTNCSACHKIDKRFIGPSPKGILNRRSPEWVMNMILDPQLMVEQDKLAKDLLVEFNGAAMANQNMTEEQAREILEDFRTL